MGRRKTTWAESLAGFLESWGITLRSAAPVRQRATIRVYGPSSDGTRVLVGTLSNEDGEYVFRYDEDYSACPELPPLATFPEKLREYRSAELWPFFHVRLPPLGRADVQNLIRERKIDEGDTLKLLGVLGAKAVATPYELRYEAA